jgi:hypothetical protein
MLNKKRLLISKYQIYFIVGVFFFKRNVSFEFGLGQQKKVGK